MTDFNGEAVDEAITFEDFLDTYALDFREVHLESETTFTYDGNLIGWASRADYERYQDWFDAWMHRFS